MDLVELILLLVILSTYLILSFIRIPHFLALNLILCYLFLQSNIIEQIIFEKTVLFLPRRRCEKFSIFLMITFTISLGYAWFMEFLSTLNEAGINVFWGIKTTNQYQLFLFEHDLSIFITTILPILFYVIFYYKWDITTRTLNIIATILNSITRPKTLLLIIKKNYEALISVASVILFLTLFVLLMGLLSAIFVWFQYFWMLVISIFLVQQIYQQTIHTTKTIVNSFRDKKRIKSYGIPENITSQMVYSNCLEYKTSSGRKQYLEILKLRRIPLDEDIKHIEEPPPELLKDKSVAEELGKLREQWYGLSSW